MFISRIIAIIDYILEKDKSIKESDLASKSVKEIETIFKNLFREESMIKNEIAK